MSPHGSRSSPRILCVDDDPAMQEYLVWKLRHSGFRAVAVSSGRDALRYAETEPIDLFVLDFEMPGMNGEQLAVELRRRWPDIPLLMISGNGGLPESARNLVDRFVHKGDDFADQLIAQVSSLLNLGATAA